MRRYLCLAAALALMACGHDQQVTGSITIDGKEYTELSGIAFDETFFFDGPVVAVTTWEGASCAGHRSDRWLQLNDEVAAEGGYFVYLELDPEDPSLDGEVWRYEGNLESVGAGSIDVVWSDLSDKHPEIGDTVSGKLTFTGVGDDSTHGSLKIEVTHCGED